MKIELNTNLIPLFSGTYESMWNITEYDDNCNELEVDYKMNDLMKSIISAYKKNEKYILSELNCKFIKFIKFTGYYMPREYNFKTDELDFTLDIDELELIKTIDNLKDNKDFSQFLKNNYSSYDGFMSFTPDNYQELSDSIKNNKDDYIQSLSAVITYLAKNNINHNGGCSIESMVYDEWQGNGYEGLNYKIL